MTELAWRFSLPFLPPKRLSKGNSEKRSRRDTKLSFFPGGGCVCVEFRTQILGPHGSGFGLSSSAPWAGNLPLESLCLLQFLLCPRPWWGMPPYSKQELLGSLSHTISLPFRHRPDNIFSLPGLGHLFLLWSFFLLNLLSFSATLNHANSLHPNKTHPWFLLDPTCSPAQAPCLSSHLALSPLELDPVLSTALTFFSLGSPVTLIKTPASLSYLLLCTRGLRWSFSPPRALSGFFLAFQTFLLRLFPSLFYPRSIGVSQVCYLCSPRGAHPLQNLSTTCTQDSHRPPWLCPLFSAQTPNLLGHSAWASYRLFKSSVSVTKHNSFLSQEGRSSLASQSRKWHQYPPNDVETCFSNTGARTEILYPPGLAQNLKIPDLW